MCWLHYAVICEVWTKVVPAQESIFQARERNLELADLSKKAIIPLLKSCDR